MFAKFHKFRECLAKPENVHLKIAISGLLVVLGLCVGIGGMKYTEAHENDVPVFAEKPKVKTAQSHKDVRVPEQGYMDTTMGKPLGTPHAIAHQQQKRLKGQLKSQVHDMTDKMAFTQKLQSHKMPSVTLVNAEVTKTPKPGVKKIPSKRHARKPWPASLTKVPKPGAKHQDTNAKRHQKLTKKPQSKMHAKMTGSLVEEEIHVLDKVLSMTSEQGVQMKPVDSVVKGHEPKVEVRGHKPKRLNADGAHKTRANASPVIAKAHGASLKEGKMEKIIPTRSAVHRLMPAVSHHKAMHKMPSGKWMNGPSHKEAMQKMAQEFGYKSHPIVLGDEMEID